MDELDDTGRRLSVRRPVAGTAVRTSRGKGPAGHSPALDKMRLDEMRLGLSRRVTTAACVPHTAVTKERRAKGGSIRHVAPRVA